MPLRLRLYLSLPSIPSRCMSNKRSLRRGQLTDDMEALLRAGGRANRERSDSVTPQMLQERINHKKLIEAYRVNSSLAVSLKDMGFGSKRRVHQVYNKIPLTADNFYSKTAPKTPTGAGGHGMLLASATKHWPVFPHMLPEVAFAGHSNSGKSTLVNAMVGVSPKSGPAGVSERAGWTDKLCFFQLGRKPPVVTLVDLPGYGHAVAPQSMLNAWSKMTKNYLSSRLILSRCYVLVDCQRGLCRADKNILRFMQKNKVPWKIILTKCDLLPAEEVAASMSIVYNEAMNIRSPSAARVHKKMEKKAMNDEISSDEDSDSEASLDEASEEGDPLLDITDVAAVRHVVIPVAASTGAGVSGLWADIKSCVRAVTNTNTHHDSGTDTPRSSSDDSQGPFVYMKGPGSEKSQQSPVQDMMVREHPLANAQRRRLASANKELRASSSFTIVKQKSPR